MNEFPIRLKSLRKSRKKTQQDMADLLSIARGSYAQYEIGRRNPDYDTIQKLADFFSVSIDYLLGRTDNPATNVIKNNSTSKLAINDNKNSDEDRPLTKENVEELFADDPEGKELMLLMMELPPEKKKIVKELLKQFRETEK